MDEGDWETAWAVFEAAYPTDGPEFPSLDELLVGAGARTRMCGSSWGRGAVCSAGSSRLAHATFSWLPPPPPLCTTRPAAHAFPSPAQEWDPEGEERAARRQRELEKQAEQARRWVRVVDDKGRAHAAGKRKSSIARVWLRPGGGHIMVNKRPFDAYFPAMLR